MTTSITDLVHQSRSPLRKRLLSYFFTNTEARLYLREIALTLGMDPANLSRELHRLEEEGVFVSEKSGLQKYFLINKSYPLYPELKSMIFKTIGVQGSLQRLVEEFSEIRLAFIYGSYASGKEKASSDIDLMIVGTPDRKRLTARVRNLENQLQREINFNLYPPLEFKKKSGEKGSFLAQVAAGKKIILKGSSNG